jgi:hypothetical protein
MHAHIFSASGLLPHPENIIFMAAPFFMPYCVATRRVCQGGDFKFCNGIEKGYNADKMVDMAAFLTPTTTPAWV